MFLFSLHYILSLALQWVSLWSTLHYKHDKTFKKEIFKYKQVLTYPLLTLLLLSHLALSDVLIPSLFIQVALICFIYSYLIEKLILLERKWVKNKEQKSIAGFWSLDRNFSLWYFFPEPEKCLKFWLYGAGLQSI